MKNDQFDELMEVIRWIFIVLICILCVLIIINFTVLVANAAPIAGATYETHVLTMRAPVAEWQQDILEEINADEHTSVSTKQKEKTKDGRKDERTTRKRDVLDNQSRRISAEHLTRQRGVFEGPSGKESFYNLPMGGVIRRMGALGFNYPYTVRDDGVKCLGPYVMCAADLSIRPKGTILQTSLGPAIVCDTGTFVNQNRYQIDIATTW